jgi:hypothetical protein
MINDTIDKYFDKNIFAFPTSVSYKYENNKFIKKIYPIKNWSTTNKKISNNDYNYNGIAIRLENLLVIDIDNIDEWEMLLHNEQQKDFDSICEITPNGKHYYFLKPKILENMKSIIKLPLTTT